MMSLDKRITITKHIFGLFDDARQYSNDWHTIDLSDIIRNLKDTIHTWDHLLSISGGKLEIEKCVTFVFH